MAFETDRISNFQGLMTLTLTLDRVILHTVVHHSVTRQILWNWRNFFRMDKCTYIARIYVCTDRRTFKTSFITSTLSKKST